ncbi:hypothetical protein VTI74DRAFT_7583 [Chaetomium olivicolor]
MASTEDEEAINLLSLDGGGIRGVSTLVILDEIMTKIKKSYNLPEVPKPCEYFHMIAGTSTGGLIAIMLGRLQMSTKEALQAYDNCSAKIFSFRNRKTWSLSERFRATTLEEVVQSIVKERGMGEEMRHPERPKKGKVVVCVMPAGKIGEPHLVRSFKGDPGSEENWDEGTTIWAAARATTAASSFFKPQRLGRGMAAQSYIDAAIGVNNPVEYLLEEAVAEFGSGRRLGCLVSIGTGTRGIKLESALTGFSKVVRAPIYYYDLIKTLKDTATNGEETHRRLRSRLRPFPGSYYRFNVPAAAEEVKLHEYKKIPLLKDLTKKYLDNKEVAKEIDRVTRDLHTDSFDHGLTLGHVYGLDKNQVFLANKKPRAMVGASVFFTGRQDILQRLDSLFAPRDTEEASPRREFLLYGMGGVGKTEVALKISEMLQRRFKYIFFIDGSSVVTVLQSYAKIAKQHKLPGVEVDELFDAALRWIDKLTVEWLMVFDDCNLNDRHDYLPRKDRGNVIYTSRSTALTEELSVELTYEVTPFEDADAIDLLLKASDLGESAADAQVRRLAENIVRELGCLPIAVDKAAAFIRDGDWSLQDYLKKLREEKSTRH